MSDKRDLSELLIEALDHIDEMGSADRARLADLIGREAYDRMISKPKTAALIDRWEAATGKARGPAIRMLSIGIAKTSDKPQLVARIHREITDTFDDGSDRAPTRGEVKKHAEAVNQKRNGQRVAYEKPKRASTSMLAELAKSNDLSRYMKARANSKGRN